jgi:hypothetical protein
MEGPKLCSKIFILEWNAFKIIPSNVDSLRICDNAWFNILTLCWTPVIIRIKFWHAKHFWIVCTPVTRGLSLYYSEFILMVLAEDVKVK